MIRFVKTKNLAPQDLTLKADFAGDFMQKVNGILEHLVPGCSLRILGLKGPQGKDLVLNCDTQISVRGLRPPEIWILGKDPYRIQPLVFNRKYECVIEELAK